jgi:hypothetical protein
MRADDKRGAACYTEDGITPTPMLETSKDLLYVVLAFCFLWITIFVSWLLYYFIAIARDVSSLVGQARGVVSRVDAITKTVHDRLDVGMSSLGTIGNAAKDVLVWFIKERLAKKKASAKKKREESED